MLTQKLTDGTLLRNFYNAIYETFLSTAADSFNENDTATKHRVKPILHPTFWLAKIVESSIALSYIRLKIEHL